MKTACEIIIKENRKSDKLYTKQDKKFAKKLKRSIKFANTFDEETFRIHSKGVGVICSK